MFTDPQKIKKDDAGHPDGCVVFAFFEIFNSDSKEKEMACKAGSIGCVACKKQVLEYLVEFMKPLAQKRKELMENRDYLIKILDEGAQKASVVADKTIEEIKTVLKL
jgi:tryptophanyl-tRNA synthetase